jgi:2-polyprenyl-3-methyl-5-hydroxy-6-metoxy-1,4-benzoquinol methylase
VSTAEHWDEVYASRAVDEVSWFQRDPAPSIRLVEHAAPDRTAAIADVGCGTSSLVDRLLDDGYADVTLVDVSVRALETVRTRLGARASKVAFVRSDVLEWAPSRIFDVWHDRAVFHFLSDESERERYVERAAAAIRPGGALILATFAADGPAQCSGLPVRRHAPDDLARTFGPAFVLEAAEREEHVTPAGVVQPFSWVVLRRA